MFIYYYVKMENKHLSIYICTFKLFEISCGENQHHNWLWSCKILHLCGHLFTFINKCGQLLSITGSVHFWSSYNKMESYAIIFYLKVT